MARLARFFSFFAATPSARLRLCPSTSAAPLDWTARCHRREKTGSAVDPDSLSASAQAEIKAVEKWKTSFSADSLVKIGAVTFSRASGPGGQNVNKVNTKATVKIPVSQLLRIGTPASVAAHLRLSSFYAHQTDTIVIQSDDTRSQRSNIDRCYAKAADLVRQSGIAVTPRLLTAQDKSRLDQMSTTRNSARLADKKRHSSKKAGRRREE